MGSGLKPDRLLLMMLVLVLSVVAVRLRRRNVGGPVVVVSELHLLLVVVKNGASCGGVESGHWVLRVNAGSKDGRRHRVVVGSSGRVGLLHSSGSLKLRLGRGWIRQKRSKLDSGGAELVKGPAGQVEVVGVGCRRKHLQATAVAVGHGGGSEALQVKSRSCRCCRWRRSDGVHLQRDLVVTGSRAGSCSGLAVRESRNEAVDGERQLDGRWRCLEVVAGCLAQAECCRCCSHGGIRTLHSSAPHQLKKMIQSSIRTIRTASSGKIQIIH